MVGVGEVQDRPLLWQEGVGPSSHQRGRGRGGGVPRGDDQQVVGGHRLRRVPAQVTLLGRGRDHVVLEGSALDDVDGEAQGSQCLRTSFLG